VTNSNTTVKAMYGGRTAGIFGYSHLTGGFAGGQAEYVRVPYGDVNLLEIPDDVPDEKALFLSDVLPTAYNAVKDTAVYPGDVVAIFGAGPVGQMAGSYAIDEGPPRSSSSTPSRASPLCRNTSRSSTKTSLSSSTSRRSVLA